jgi:hypothetical protein
MWVKVRLVWTEYHISYAHSSGFPVPLIDCEAHSWMVCLAYDVCDANLPCAHVLLFVAGYTTSGSSSSHNAQVRRLEMHRMLAAANA